MGRDKAARRSRTTGGNTHFAPAAKAADVNSFKGQNACSDDIERFRRAVRRLGAAFLPPFLSIFHFF